MYAAFVISEINWHFHSTETGTETFMRESHIEGESEYCGVGLRTRGCSGKANDPASRRADFQRLNGRPFRHPMPVRSRASGSRRHRLGGGQTTRSDFPSGRLRSLSVKRRTNCRLLKRPNVTDAGEEKVSGTNGNHPAAQTLMYGNGCLSIRADRSILFAA